MAETADFTELRLLCLHALSAGEQAVRRQLRADQEDPESKHAQASVTRRVHSAKAVWEREKEYNDLASILRSLESPYREFFIRAPLVRRSPRTRVKVKPCHGPGHRGPQAALEHFIAQRRRLLRLLRQGRANRAHRAVL